MSFIALEGKDLIIINKQTQSFSCPSKLLCFDKSTNKP